MACSASCGADVGQDVFASYGAWLSQACDGRVCLHLQCTRVPQYCYEPGFLWSGFVPWALPCSLPRHSCRLSIET